jgi:hypothetical protein
MDWEGCSLMNATNFWIHQQTRKAVSSLSLAQCQVRRARSIPELIHAMQSVHVDHLVRAVGSVRAEASQVRLAAEQRAHELVAELVAECAAVDASEDLLIASHGLHETYRLCCGNFPQEAHLLQRFMATHRAKIAARPIGAPPLGATST